MHRRSGLLYGHHRTSERINTQPSRTDFTHRPTLVVPFSELDPSRDAALIALLTEAGFELQEIAGRRVYVGPASAQDDPRFKARLGAIFNQPTSKGTTS